MMRPIGVTSKKRIGLARTERKLAACNSSDDRMKKMAVHVYEEMLYMRTRSDQQHATNASTRGRLLWVEVVMMLAVLVMGLWQIRYLREYFRQKKVI